MLRRPFGSSGFDVPALGFGAMQIGAPDLEEAQVARALDHLLATSAEMRRLWAEDLTEEAPPAAVLQGRGQ